MKTIVCVILAVLLTLAASKDKACIITFLFRNYAVSKITDCAT